MDSEISWEVLYFLGGIIVPEMHTRARSMSEIGRSYDCARDASRRRTHVRPVERRRSCSVVKDARLAGDGVRVYRVAAQGGRTSCRMTGTTRR